MKNKKRKNNKIIIIISLLLIILIGVIIFIYYSKDSVMPIIDNTKEIEKHYNEFVKTNKEAILYNEKEEEIGKIGKDVELTLNNINIDKNTKYFSIKDLEGYYIKYEDVDKIDKLTDIDQRYKEYIPFNQNIVTNDTTNFYDENDNLIYSLKKELSLPIIIKEDDKYGVEYNNRLLYVKTEDVKEVVDNHNTDKTNSTGVAVLNYHAFYDENDAEARANCNTSICHSRKQFKSQLDLIKEKGMLTLKMKEVEMYIDGKIRLPKSVLITIDDGGRTKDGIDLLTEYKMYATIFLVTAWFDPKDYYKTEYIELHSHSDHMHETGDCPTGQGGGIQCLDEKTIQEDLKKSREKLNNTTYFCYPFYEYNEYSIKMLKEAGFTMAFIGESTRSDNLVHVGSDKFRLRRFVIADITTIEGLTRYFDQIK